MNESTFAVANEENSQNSSAHNPLVTLRRVFFVLSILFFLGVLVFLVYYNGKSIYANGL